MGNLILCDCFGVILDEVAVGWFRDHFEDKAMADALKDKYFVDVDLGNISLDDVFEKMGKELGFDTEEIKKDWYLRVKIRQDVLDYIDELRSKGNTLVLLSNAGYPFIHDMIKKFSFEKHFDKIFVSCDHHLIKPDPAFYSLAVNSFEEKFDKIFMIDDSPRNLEPLKDLGITPLLFLDLELLKKSF